MPVGGIGRVVGDLLLLIVALVTADVLAVMAPRLNAVALRDNYRKVFCCQLGLCAVLMLFALDARFGVLGQAQTRVGRIAGGALRVGVSAAAAGILFFCCRVAAGSLIRSARSAERAIVPGMALVNGRPTRDLLYRLDAARDFLRKNPGATLILTGGNPDASGRTEAAVMRALLEERGVTADRMILEDKARLTIENFVNTARMLPLDAPVVLITSDYHMDRAARDARRAGFTHVLRLPARSDPLAYGSNLMWEVALDIHDRIKR